MTNHNSIHNITVLNPTHMETEKIISVHLGRFAPYHLGHEKTTREMINKYGQQNTLVLIGSSNKLDERTPFTFEQRREMIQRVFPDMQILGLPDVDTSKLKFDESTLETWTQTVLDLQKQLNARLRFCGGSREDLDYLAPHFETEVLIDRTIDGNQISATEVRKALHEKNLTTLSTILNPLNIEPVLTAFEQNKPKIF
jgi:nicotinamide mononucleotide adenylyltransferase